MKNKNIKLILITSIILIVSYILGNLHLFKNFEKTNIKDSKFDQIVNIYYNWKSISNSPALILLVDFQSSKIIQMVNKLHSVAKIDSFIESANYGNPQEDSLYKALNNFKIGKSNDLAIYLNHKGIQEMVLLSQLPVGENNGSVPFKNGITISFQVNDLKCNDYKLFRSKISSIIEIVTVIANQIKPRKVQMQIDPNQNVLEIATNKKCKLL